MKKAIKGLIKAIIELYCNSFETTPAEALKEILTGTIASITVIVLSGIILRLSCHLIVFLKYGIV